MTADGCVLDCPKSKTIQKVHQVKNSFVVNNIETDKLRCLFNIFTGVFLQEFSCGKNYRPLPPMLGDGQCVNLFKLFLVVREKGGYNSVTEKGAWDLVGEKFGLGLGFGGAFKLIYVKYLDVLERWIDRVPNNKISDEWFKGFGGGDSRDFLMELEEELKEFLSGILDQKKKDGEEYSSVDLDMGLKFKDCGKMGHDRDARLVGSDIENVEDNLHLEPMSGSESANLGLCRIADRKGFLESDGSGNYDENDVNMDSMSGSNVQKSRKLCDIADVRITRKTDDVVKKGSDEEEMLSNSSEVNGESFSQRKRKRESIWGMLNWVLETSKDPGDPAIGEIPERSKWKSYGNNELWKQVLLARQELFSKRKFSSSAEQEIWQKRQMHPFMYDDNSGAERPRFSPRLLSVSNSKARPSSESSPRTISGLDGGPSLCTAKAEYGTTKSSNKEFIAGWSVDGRNRDKVPVGTAYQAKIPPWTGIEAESDSKWLGTRIWPLDKRENRNLIERDPIGKGRQDACGCQFVGSPQCVRFHIAEKRSRVKLELGTAFYSWKFDKMGEEVTISWTKQEEDKFDAIVRSNPPSMEKCFWHQMFKLFTSRSREDLVSYYFNVFLLRRRAEQNRLTPSNIDSDDDETEYGSFSSGTGQSAVNSPSSIFYSPKKQHKRES